MEQCPRETNFLWERLFQLIKYKTMTRKNAKELLPIIQAFAEGKSIQRINSLGEWSDVTGDVLFYCNPEDYRIKPEPESTYRPFKDAEECWQEMQKHQPFGWIKCKDNSIPGKFMYIISVRDNEVAISSAIDISYSELIKYYTFTDGTPLGIKE